MTECNKSSTINELPECSDVSNNTSYLIVEKPTGTCKMKISDLVIGAENVNFYPELLQILNKLDELLSVVQPNSANWNSTHQQVLTARPVWDQTGDYNLQQLSQDVDQNKDKWNNTSTTMQLNSAQWDNTYQRVATDGDNWDTAYTNVVVYEQTYLTQQQTYFGQDLDSVYMTVQTYSASW